MTEDISPAQISEVSILSVPPSIVVGADGNLGGRITDLLRESGTEVFGTALMQDTENDFARFDLAEPTDSPQWPDKIENVFVMAAVTSIEQCRLQPESSSLVNVRSTVAVAEQLIPRSQAIIFPSTNLVFDGATEQVGAETAPNPKCEYGRQKAKAESELMQLGDNVSIVRLTKVFAKEVKLISDWARQLTAGEVIRPFSDMYLAPITVDFAAGLMIKIAACRQNRIWQISADRDISYFQIAEYLANRLNVSGTLVEPMKTKESGLCFEIVPQHTTLDMTQVTELFGITPPSPWRAIDMVIDSYIQQETINAG